MKNLIRKIGETIMFIIEFLVTLLGYGLFDFKDGLESYGKPKYIKIRGTK